MIATGILSAAELLVQLASDRVIPRLFLRHLPVTHSPYGAVLIFVAFCGALYASAGADVNVMSDL
jgi:amino acid transporter